MIKYLTICVLSLLALVSCQQDMVTEVPRDDFSVVPDPTAYMEKGQVRIKFRELPEDIQAIPTRSGGIKVGHEALDAAAEKIRATGMTRLFPYAGKFEPRTRKAGLHLWYTVNFNENMSVREAMKTLSAVPDIAIVEPVLIAKSEAVEGFPYNDPLFEDQWFLHNPGTNGMVAGCDIGILDAWKIEKGKKEVIVAVSDTKIDLWHEDLVANFWKNPGEYKLPPSVDNDGDGYVGNWFGPFGNPYNLQTYRPDRGSDHGTHVAGIVAAKNNNGKGVCGIAGGDAPDNGVQIMACGSNPAHIKYAADHGAVISTNSWFLQDPVAEESVQALQEAIDYFVEYAGVDENGEQTGPMRGGIVIASAGNEGKEAERHIPASLDKVIAVASIGPNFKKSGFSNYAHWVDISAPGGADGAGWQIMSTFPNDTYQAVVGTSMATPVVAGVAALIVSKFGGVGSGLTPYEVEYRLLRGVKSIAEYNPEYEGKLGVGCVNALLALSDEPVNFPPTIVPDEKNPSGFNIYNFGEQAEYVFTVSDPEDGVDVTYVLDDPSGAFTAKKEEGKITLSMLNRDCQYGDHTIRLTVTDKGEISTSVSFDVKLQPEFLAKPEIEPVVTDELTLQAGVNFSGLTTVQLYDASGNLVLEQQVSISLKEPGKINLDGMAGGNYVLKMTCNNKTITKNIIKL